MHGAKVHKKNRTAKRFGGKTKKKGESEHDFASLIEIDALLGLGVQTAALQVINQFAVCHFAFIV